LELDQIFFKNPVLVFYLWLGFGHPLVLTFDRYGCPFACFTNYFLFILFFVFSEQAQAVVFFFCSAQAQKIEAKNS
jgi:hypothetical protein